MTGTRAKICPQGQEVHRRPPRQGAEREDRDLVVHEPPGIEGNEVADGWAKLAADEPDAHGVAVRSARGNSPCHARLPMSSAASPSRSGQKPRAGPGSNSPGPVTANIAPARSRSRTPRWRRPINASPCPRVQQCGGFVVAFCGGLVVSWLCASCSAVVWLWRGSDCRKCCNQIMAFPI